jgi:hypothetical protein
MPAPQATTSVVGLVIISLGLSALAYRSLSHSDAVTVNWRDGQKRMTNQHAVIRTIVSAPPPPEKASDDAAPLPVRVVAPKPMPAWLLPEHSFLAFNEHARSLLREYTAPAGTTLHFTFGSGVMMDFVKNWVHFVRKAPLSPFLLGAADLALLRACGEMGLPAAGINPDLDVWTYQKKAKTSEVYEMKSEWK